MIVSLLHGGRDFAGISGRRTASACETNAIETNVIAAAHFMSRGLIKIQTRDKKNFCAIAIIKCKATPGHDGLKR